MICTVVFATITTIESFITVPGFFLRQLDSVLVGDLAEYNITGTPTEKSTFNTMKESYINALVSNIKGHFVDVP